MRKLSREEKRIIDMLFNHLFTIEFKIKFIKLLTKTSTHTYVNMFRKEKTKINEMFDCLVDYEDKIEGIKLCYEVKGFNVESIEDMIENRHIIEENIICTDWQTSTERRKQKLCYI